MSILLPAVVVAFAAFCVWLTVRIVNRRERWAKWTLAAVVFGLPVLYVASFGPACWVAADQGQIANVPVVYWPIGASVPTERTMWGDFVFWWGRLGIPDGHSVWVPMSSDGTRSFWLH